MLKLSTKELKAIAKITGIKGCKSMSEDELLSTLNSSKPVKKCKNKKTLYKSRIKKIRKEFNESRHKFSKSKINEIRRNLYEIENEKSPSTKKYLNMIRPYLSDKINDHKTQRKLRIHSGNKRIEYKTQSQWKVQLTMAINFISSKNSDETRTMHTKSNNVEIMMVSETDEIIEELFEYFAERSRRARGLKC